MDNYLPVCDTVKPSLSIAANDQPWRALSDTHSLLWYATPRVSHNPGLSSVGEAIHTFVVVQNPVLAGLERLRAFRSWKDNWDAEGSKAPDPAVLETASKIFALLSVHRVPTVALSADGDPMFIYGAPLHGEVVVTGIDQIDYFFADDGAPEGESVGVGNATLPIDLIAHLHSA